MSKWDRLLSLSILLVFIAFLFFISSQKDLVDRDNSIVKSIGTLTGLVIFNENEYFPSEENITSINKKREELAKYGYIVELYDEPLLARKERLENENFNIRGINKIRDINTEAENYKIELISKQNNVRDKINSIKSERRGFRFGISSIPEQSSPLINVFNGFVIDATEEEVSEIEKLPEVKKVYPNYEIKLSLADSVPLINADDVWKLQNSSGSNFTGEGIIISIIDTGIDYTHPDLGGCFGEGCKVMGGRDFINSDSDPKDDNYHGTHVASIAAANGVIKGVAPEARLMAYKVLNNVGTGPVSAAVYAIDTSAYLGVDIISMSFGNDCGGSYSEYCGPLDVVGRAVSRAVESGVIVVASVGNTGQYYKIDSPAANPEAIGVGASNKLNVLESYSSRGPAVLSYSGQVIHKPDVLAPGGSIIAAGIGGTYRSSSGTSMAAPHVAGLAALLKQKYPEANPEEIKSLIKTSSVDLGYALDEQGSGRVDALRAINGSIAVSADLDFGNIEAGVGAKKQKEIIISNLENYPVAVTLNSTIAKKDSSTFNAVSFSQDSFEIGARQNISVIMTIDSTNTPAEGTYTGKIFLNDGKLDHYLPYRFAVKSRLMVGVDDRKAIIYVYDSNLNQIWTSYPNSVQNVSLFISPGSYVAYLYNPSNSAEGFFFSDALVLPSFSSVQKIFSLKNSKNISIEIKNSSGNNINLNGLLTGVLAYKNKITSSGNYKEFNSIYSINSSKYNIYINLSADSAVVNNDFYLSYDGNGNSPDIDGLDSEFYSITRIFDKADSLSNNIQINNSDYGKYILNYEYPGVAPIDYIAHNTFDILPLPYHENSFIYDVAVPSKQDYYVLRKNDVPSNYPKNFSLTFSTAINYLPWQTQSQRGTYLYDQREYNNRIINDSSVPQTAGEIRHIKFGEKYKPVSLGYVGGNITLLNYLIIGNGTYMWKNLKIKDSSGNVRQDIEKPLYKIYRNNTLIKSGDLTRAIYESGTSTLIDWTIWEKSALSQTIQSGYIYEIYVKIPLMISVYNSVEINASIDATKTDNVPPRLTHIDIPQRYISGENINILFNATENNPGIIVRTYHNISGVWNEVTPSAITDGYVSSFKPSGSKLDFKIDLEDSSGNSQVYIFNSASLLEREILIDYRNNSFVAGNLFSIYGNVSDGENMLRNLLIKINRNGEPVNSFKTSSAGYYFDVYKGWTYTNGGEFSFNWSVPDDYSVDDKISLTFGGSGAYSLNEIVLQNSPIEIEICSDGDGDGYNSTGGECGVIDCNDRNSMINPSSSELCDGLDNDCDGEIDESILSLTCELQQGVCSGSVKTCSGELGWNSCNYRSHSENFEQIETSCSDGLDNDCDGNSDINDSDCPLPVCTFTDARWSKSESNEGEILELTVIGENCDGKELLFEVLEEDTFPNQDDETIINPNSTYFVNNSATTYWVSEYQKDVIDPPEYYFVATLREDTENKIDSRINDNPLVEVTQTKIIFEERNISLKEGKNVISIPLVVQNNSLEYLFGENIGDIERISSYGPNGWEVYYSDGKPGNLKLFEPGRAYIIVANKEYTIKLNGSKTNSDLSKKEIELKRGWNFIGTFSTREKINNIFKNNIIREIFAYNKTTENYEKINDFDTYVNEDEGLWIYSENESRATPITGGVVHEK